MNVTLLMLQDIGKDFSWQRCDHVFIFVNISSGDKGKGDGRSQYKGLMDGGERGGSEPLGCGKVPLRSNLMRGGCV